ncbi:MAG TPA: hypothetical protein VGM55_02340, partial [Cedecea sp.]
MNFRSPYGPLLRSVQTRLSARQSYSLRVVNCLVLLTITANLMPGSSLLSHGETPHYHRRYGVSLLSS